MARKLASIQQIKSINSIENADAIESITFKDIGWVCVAKKGEFKPGDICAYFEIDSFLPEKEIFEFLRPSSFRIMFTGQRGFKLKTVKLRGQVSQGLALPISLFPEMQNKKIGEDVTEILGVIKWESESEGENIKGEMPGIIQKPDQTRIQTLLDFFEKHKETEFEETLKLDGTSITIYCNEGNVGVCGRNMEFEKSYSVPAWKITIESGLENVLQDLNLNIALQFELMGPGIQRNKEKLTEPELYLYNIQDLNTTKFFSSRERIDLFDRINEKLSIKIKHVLILNKNIKIFQKCSTIEEILKHADGKSINADKREGVVFKSVEPINGEILQFKVISNKFLLSEKD